MKLKNLMSRVELILSNEANRVYANSLVCKLVKVGIKLPSSEALGAVIADFLYTLETAECANLSNAESYLLGKILDALEDFMAVCVAKERM